MPEPIKNITVLMPAYNCGKYIAHSVKSILSQTHKDFELIIIDDGSDDNTEEIVMSFKEPRIIYRKTVHMGTSAALNLGLSIALNDWVARIDADDLNVPDRLEKQIKFLDENPDYDIVSCWSVYFKDPAKVLFLLEEPVEHEDIYEHLDLHNRLNQSGVIYRKSIIIEAGYNENYKNNEDFELFHRIRDSVKFYNIPEFLVYTRIRSDSRTYSNNNHNIYDFLFPVSFKNMFEAKSKGEHFYWATTIAWLNYFFGDRKSSRGYFKNSFSLKNIAAYLTTFLPDKYFNKFINSHLKYRLKTIFRSSGNYKEELKRLLG